MAKIPFSRSLLVAIALVGAGLAALPVLAQRSGPAVGNTQAPTATSRDSVAGRFDYYTLALSWSPSHCAGLTKGDYDPQCHRRDGKRFSFILHGLWPQFERGYPEYCPTKERAFVPQSTIDRMQDIMPSPRLVIHQFRKHGTCSGLTPDGYFDLSRKAFAKVKIPQRFNNPPEPFFVSPKDVVREMVEINPGLKPDMLSVVCGGPGNRLREVRVCFSREGEFRTCGQNENQRRQCSADRMFVPPVREGAPPAPAGKTGPGERRI